MCVLAAPPPFLERKTKSKQQTHISGRKSVAPMCVFAKKYVCTNNRKCVFMKKLKVFLVWLVVLVLCAGCSSSGVKVAQPTIDHPPYCDVILKSLGEPLNEVLPALGLEAEAFTYEENKNAYILNEPIDFMGYKFEMQLLVDFVAITTPVVIAARYVLKVETPESGAQIVADLRDELLKGYGAAYNGSKYYFGKVGPVETNPPSPLNNYTKEDLLNLFMAEGGGGRASLEWLLSVDLSHIPLQVLDEVSNGKLYTCITATLSGDYPVTDIPENEQLPYVLIQLNYGLSRSY